MTHDRPLPRSYMTEQDRKERADLSQNAMYLVESRYAGNAGDEEAAWAWLALTKAPDFVMAAIKEIKGVEFLRAKGFNV